MPAKDSKERSPICAAPPARAFPHPLVPLLKLGSLILLTIAVCPLCLAAAAALSLASRDAIVSMSWLCGRD